MKTPLKFEELTVGMEVEDDGEAGKVVECDDPHNVLIEYNNGGSGLYCMVDDCEEKDITPLYKLTE
jgi:hypothetical protein